ncbi:unnamed protein product [Cyprideis torosa]|uniref:Uncharacterized protein n=1 Tax=Cyprideis torosa TaxID=163714 RepID=A0A7R8ZPU5_9CRUS|nr:unnamed protein product [Cyprideis torosa]CAG0901386.1 unnamed protein product [Cyprideis torosa]
MKTLLTPTLTMLLNLLSVVQSYRLLPRNSDLFITISSSLSRHEGRTVSRQVELHWSPDVVTTDDKIALFRQHPIDSPGVKSIFEVTHPLTSSGNYKMPVMMPYLNFSESQTLGNGSCVNLFIALVSSNGTPLAVNCLRIQSHWMSNMRNQLWDAPLNKVLIPGSHNAGAYRQFSSDKSNNLLTRYSFCQDEDVWTQLAFGIRFLDIRVGYYLNKPVPSPFYVNHDFVRIRNLLPILEDVQKFLDQTDEIVILDLHRFPSGFSRDTADDVHEQLVGILQSMFGDLMAPRYWKETVPLGQLWSSGRRLVVGYADAHMRKKYDFLWHDVVHKWADAQKLSELEEYAKRVAHNIRSSRFLSALMLSMTLPTMQMVTNPLGSVRTVADLVNRAVPQWFREIKDFRDNLNVACVDYFLGSDIVSLAIQVNDLRYPPRSDWVPPKNYTAMTTTARPVVKLDEEGARGDSSDGFFGRTLRRFVKLLDPSIEKYLRKKRK